MGFLAGFKDLVTSIAPAIGASLGGPLGGVAMKFLADKFTDGDTGKVEEFFLGASPEHLLQLKTAEIEYNKFVQELGIRRSQLEVEDRGSARDLAKNRGIVVQASLSALYTVGFFLTLFMFITGRAAVAEGYSELVMILIGALTAPQIQILNFWFGSSRGSAEKTSLIAKANGKGVVS